MHLAMQLVYYFGPQNVLGLSELLCRTLFMCVIFFWKNSETEMILTKAHVTRNNALEKPEDKADFNQQHNISDRLLSDNPCLSTSFVNPPPTVDHQLPHMDDCIFDTHRAPCRVDQGSVVEAANYSETQSDDVTRLQRHYHYSDFTLHWWNDSYSLLPKHTLFTMDSDYSLCSGLGLNTLDLRVQELSSPTAVRVPRKKNSLRQRGTKKANLSIKWRFGKMKMQEFVVSLRGEYVVSTVDTIFRAGRLTLDEIGLVLMTHVEAHSDDYQPLFEIYQRLAGRVKLVPKETEIECELRTSFTKRESSSVKILYLGSLMIHYPDLIPPSMRLALDSIPFFSHLFSPKPFFVLTVYKLYVEISDVNGSLEEEEKDLVNIRYLTLEST